MDLDHNAQYADILVDNMQVEHEYNIETKSYYVAHRDVIRDAVLFALDNGWTP